MTDKEIINALNTATNIEGLHIYCIDYDNKPKVKTMLSIKSDIVDLINRQQAEIERLKPLEENFDKLLYMLNAVDIGQSVLEKQKHQIKAEAIKEFWGKLWELDPEIIGKVVSFDLDEMNNLKKELVGEDK